MAENEKLISELESRLAACGDDGWCTVSAEMLRHVIDDMKERVPRVLTADEVRAGADMCCEWRHYPAEIVLVNDNTNRNFCRMFLQTGGEAEESWKHYNKLWRCWTSLPTEEQMRETPWEGEAE